MSIHRFVRNLSAISLLATLAVIGIGSAAAYASAPPSVVKVVHASSGHWDSTSWD
ncbi:hypothetical protein [Sphaerimonospora thailandensis]|uniref:Uncharacterized protein n=1 Tax=Sphaerimonospora thailandensis TaxID=795644 RepID=A0A8J3RFF3_9ACTN|nr:hypothetical protein [Sphaerimonospora thailandensis]GIH73281.1 hypothetical protein Mth01_55340 [Sphaerimonospora thailandensis]